MAASIALIQRPARQNRGRYLFRSLILIGIAWLAGFVWFLHLASRDPAAPPRVDAIVVLTGGRDRVEVALRLMANGTAERLLISGAGEKTDLASLVHTMGIDTATLEPGITLGHAAHSTRGNALETAGWARDQETRTLLVVTSWFHMPRALIELRRAMPAVTIYPHAVGRLDLAEAMHASEARRLIGEYHKFVAAWAGLTASPVVIAAWGTESAR